MKKKNNKGFSLIELIIAIAILVILTGLLAPQFMKYIEKSREAKDMQTLDSIYSAVQGAMSDEKAYTDIVTKAAAGKNAYKAGKTLAEVQTATGDFLNEFTDLLGTPSDKLDDITLESAKATGGDIRISIDYDNEMSVKVFYGTVAADGTNKVIGDLVVGGTK